MGHRVTVILFALLAVTGALLYRAGYNPGAAPAPTGSPNDDSINPNPPLVAVTVAEVERIVLRANGIQRASLRQADSWSGQDPGLVAEFLKDVSTLRLLSELDTRPDELAQFGLDPPHGVVEIQLKGGKGTKTLEIGVRNPSTTGVYVRLGGGQVGVAGALIEWEFQRLFRKLAADTAV